MPGFVPAKTEIADGSITTAKLANDAITTPKLANDAITTPKLANDAITTVKLANDAVKVSKLASSELRFKSGPTQVVTTLPVNVLLLDLGNISAGDIFTFFGTVLGTKGLNAGMVNFELEQNLGLATIDFFNDGLQATWSQKFDLNEIANYLLVTNMRVLASGSMKLEVKAECSAGDFSISTGRLVFCVRKISAV